MPTDANKIVLAILMAWYFLIRFHYQSIARLTHPVQADIPLRDRLLNASTSLWILPALLFTFTSWIDPLRLPFPHWLQKTGAVITAAGILLFWWTHFTLGRNWSPFLQMNLHARFVQVGPYRWVRHPMYLSVIITGIGVTLLTANWLVGVVFLLPALYSAAVRIPAEEKLLLGVFGDNYRAYQQRTARLFPLFVFLKRADQERADEDK
ncbi:MAG TPA: isoprenylcysteine carboxylmethyltransferase family protein [Anaerolineaceae bacterium]